MVHGIEVHLAANIDKYKQGMDAAKKMGSDSMGYIASIFDKIKSMFGGMWDSFKLFFSNIGDQSKSAFGSMSDSASGVFQKIMAMLPGFQSSMDKTKDKIGEADDKSTGLITKIGVSLVAAFVAATAAISAFVKKGLEADGAIAKLSISGDIGASSFTRFEAVALRSGMSVTEFGGAMGKLHDEMKKAAAGDDAGIFDKLDVKIVDANNALLKTDEVTVEVAKKIAAMSSEAEKYDAAAKVGFADKVQVLEDIAHASTLAASTTDDQAASVFRLGKIWHEILPGGKSMWAEISTFLTANLTPAMTDSSVAILNSKNTIVDAFNQIFGTGPMFPKLGDKIKEWGQQASQWFSSVAQSATSATISIMKFIAEKTGLGNPNAYVKPATPPGFVPDAVVLASGKNKPIVTDAEKKQTEEYDAQTKAIAEKIAATKMEIQTQEALTEGQRMAIKMAVGLRDGTLKLTDAQKSKRTEDLNALITQEKLSAQIKDAKAAADAASKKESEAYATHIAAIRAKIDENRLLLALNEGATESQKMQIKLDQELASGKLKLSAAHIIAAQAGLVELGVTEQDLKLQAAQKDVTEYIAASTAARDKESAALAVQYKMYGKSTDARAMEMVVMDAQIWKEGELAKLRTEHKPITDQIIAQLNAEEKARILVGQATLGQGKALEYAAQLADENKKFSAESIFDERGRAEALLRIDAAVWQERIKNAGDGTEAQKLLQGEYLTWYQNQLLKPQLDANRKMWESVDQTAHDTFISIFDSGKSAFDRLRDTLKNGLLDLLYQMTIKKWIFNIAASVTGGSASNLAQAASGISGSGTSGSTSYLSIAQSAKAAYDAISSGFAGLSSSVADGVQVGMNATGMSNTILTNGPAAQAAGSIAGYAGGIAAGKMIGSAISGQYGIGDHGSAVVNIATAAGAIFGGPIGAAIGGTLGGLLNRAFGMGPQEVTGRSLTGTLAGGSFSGTSNENWHQDGGWFRSDKNGVNQKPIDAESSKALSDAYEQIKLASADFATVLGINATSIASRTQALNIAITTDAEANKKAISDFFLGVGDTIAREMVPSIAMFKKEGESAATTFQRIAGDYAFIDVALGSIGKQFGAVGVSSVNARERLLELTGGLDAFGQSTAFFAQNYLSEAERMAPVAAQVAASFAKLGISGVDTRDEFKSLVLGLDLTTAAGATTYAGLMGIQEAFAQLYPAISATNSSLRTAADILSERTDLQKQLDQLTMTSAQLLTKQRNALDASNRDLFDQIQAAQKLKDAQDAAKTSLGDVISKMKSFGDSAKALHDGLLTGGLSTLTPEQQYAETKRQYESTLALAKGGDTTAQGQFSAMATAFLTASQKVNSGDSQYGADFAGILQTSDDMAKWASGQVDVAQASLDALNAQVIGISDLNATMLSVADAINGLPAAFVATPSAVVMPAPVINYSTMGTANTEALVAEVKALREEVAGLRSDQQKQTGDSIGAVAQVQQDAAQTIVDGVGGAISRAVSAAQKVALE